MKKKISPRVIGLALLILTMIVGSGLGIQESIAPNGIVPENDLPGPGN